MKNDIMFTPYSLTQDIQLKNRIVMAPMTRSKANDDLSPTEAMSDYYARRADAGLIITEGTIIRADGLGYPNVPGIYTQNQIEQWANVTRAVHANGGKIFMQIWHVGRVSHPSLLNGQLPISPSATVMNGRVKRSENLYYGAARAISLDEIQQLIADYTQAAKNAMQAGFDGVEIHGANGYLIDQFLHLDTNHRADDYGVTPKNMSRFAIEIVKSISQAIGSSRVGIRLSPGAYLNEIHGDVRDRAVFEYLLNELSNFNIAYIHTGNFDDSVTFAELNNQTMTNFMRSNYHGNLIAAGGYELEQAQAAIEAGLFDLVAIGRPFIANPDLINQLKLGNPLKDYHADMLATLN